MADLKNVKHQLKKWEAAFFQVNQKKPTKDDISQAPQKIKDMYRMYNGSKHQQHCMNKEHVISEKTARVNDTASVPPTPPPPPLPMSNDKFMCHAWGPELNKSVKNSFKDSRCSGVQLLEALGDRLYACTSASLKVATKKNRILLSTSITEQDDSACQQMMSSEDVNGLPLSNVSLCNSAENLASASFCSNVIKLRVRKKRGSCSHPRIVRQPLHEGSTQSSASSICSEFAGDGKTCLNPTVSHSFLDGTLTGNCLEIPEKRVMEYNDECLFGPNKSDSVEMSDASIRTKGKVDDKYFVNGNIEAGAMIQLDDVACDRQFLLQYSGDDCKLTDTHYPSTVPSLFPDVKYPDSTLISSRQVRIKSLDDPIFIRNGVEECRHRVCNSGDNNSDVMGQDNGGSSAYRNQTDKISCTGSQGCYSPYQGRQFFKESPFSYFPSNQLTVTGENDCSAMNMDVSGHGIIASISGDANVNDAVGHEECFMDDTGSTEDSHTGQHAAKCVSKGSKNTTPGNKVDHSKHKMMSDNNDDLTCTVDNDSDNSEDKHSLLRHKMSKKVSRVHLLSTAKKSDNFVRLSMKVKRYSKNKGRLSGAQWRRRQWKAKMSAKCKNYGNKCFRCGKCGHWSNNCPEATVNARMEPSLTTETISVNEDEFPSLLSALSMARGDKSDDLSNCGPEGLDDEVLLVDCLIDREVCENQPFFNPVRPFSESVSDVEMEIKTSLQVFGFTSFKDGQMKAIDRILHGQSTLVILSTGGGKSLCYQLPALLYAQQSRCIALIISPLVSLMEDQVTGLPTGVKGVCLNSNMTVDQRNRVLESVRNGSVHFLLVSPEAVVGGNRWSHGSFPSAYNLPPICFACIDEVHCLSEWSHNFRPSYLRLCKVLRDQYGVTCFLGLTATATQSTALDIARHLCIPTEDDATIRGSSVPHNLYLSVSRDKSKEEALLNLLQGKRFSSCSSIIIYCTRRDQVERIATLIRTSLQLSDSLCINKNGTGRGVKQAAVLRPTSSAILGGRSVWTAEGYHAGMLAAARRRVQKSFMAGHIRVVVATVALGMGLNKADVRGIIHYNLPKTFENYVQEIGRAGRDGLPSHCHLFLDCQGDDVIELQRHTFGNSVDRHTLKKLLSRVFKDCKCPDTYRLRQRQLCDPLNVCEAGGDGKRVCPGHVRTLIVQQTSHELDVREESLETMLCYLELHMPHLLTNLSPTYATCTLQCYQGSNQLLTIAKQSAPVAAAIALQKLAGKKFSSSNAVEFSLTDVCDTMGWDSALIKRELKSLEWTHDHTGPRRSGVLVTYSDLALHVRSCGDLQDYEFDGLLDFLYQRVARQEFIELRQLNCLYKVLKDVSHKNYWMCSDDVDTGRSEALKTSLNRYFIVREAGDMLDTCVDDAVKEIMKGIFYGKY